MPEQLSSNFQAQVSWTRFDSADPTHPTATSASHDPHGTMSDDGYALSEGDFSPSSVASLDSILRSQVYSPEVDSPLGRDDDATPRVRHGPPGRLSLIHI